MSLEQQLNKLGFMLPGAPKPVATYVPATRVGDLLFLSGVVPSREGRLLYQGKLGRELTVQEGYEATQHTLLNALAIIRDELGSLEQIKKVVRMTGYVASAEGFTGQPAVVNGASDLLVQLFGENGRHARVAVGVAELPLGAPVELELIVECYSS
ncbi:MAG: RidA family protein [Nitrospirota bacterium]|nr:RidA family protein [Nitrospirota bacterium]